MHRIPVEAVHKADRCWILPKERDVSLFDRIEVLHALHSLPHFNMAPSFSATMAGITFGLSLAAIFTSNRKCTHDGDDGVPNCLGAIGQDSVMMDMSNNIDSGKDNPLIIACAFASAGGDSNNAKACGNTHHGYNC